MKKHIWYLLLLIIASPCIEAVEAPAVSDDLNNLTAPAQTEHNSWWQSRTKVERASIIAAGALSSTLLIGLGVKKIFFNKEVSEEEQELALITQSTHQGGQLIVEKARPIIDFHPFTDNKREGTYLVLPKTKKLISTTQAGKSFFLIHETGGNVKSQSSVEEVEVIPIEIALRPNLKSIYVFNECRLDSTLLFYKGESAAIQKEDNTVMLTKKLRYLGQDHYFPCIRVAGYYLILPLGWDRLQEDARE